MQYDDANIREEAEAFDKRIDERVQAGFIPDLRLARKCDYFYKSFWRDPLFIKLYLGWIMDGYLDLIHTHCGRGLRILDVGCGAGYMSLELARAGHHVQAIDISESCIEHGRETLANNPFTDGFGSLAYSVQPFEKTEGQFDLILFSVSMHHMADVDGVVAHAHSLLPKGGHLLFYEPCHERFRTQDAAQVALIRGLLAITGHWFDPQETAACIDDEEAMQACFRDIHVEYVLERDKDEPDGQSPHDLEASGEQILAAAKKHFTQIETRPGCSFIYRLLGGIRGPQEMVEQLARFITTYERACVGNGFIHENMFFFLGKKDGQS